MLLKSSTLHLLQRWFVSIVGLVILSGCATVVKSPFDRQSTSLDLSEKSVVVLTVNFTNNWRSKYQPNGQMILRLERPQAESKKDRANILETESEFVRKGDSSTSVVFRGAIEPGVWKVTGISGASTRALINGNFHIPFNCQFELPPQTFAYLGTVNAVVRRRGEGEFRSGSAIPLLDQSVSGFGTGTFDVTIENDLNTVKAALQTNYPALKNIEIKFVPGLSWERSEFDKQQADEQEEN